eukprot:TRINITY_DN1044_c0_g1_i1.p1 TRINITY_DN1044_c0_g1~~TRINITY_DN1044_c0_g1_i1.p1  ORF type:complete len:791 (-),score=130.72 TRINITY_DN1044_c0_g1_i1:39-2411(-)
MPLQEVNIPRNSKPLRRGALSDHNKENFPLNSEKGIKSEVVSPRATKAVCPHSPKRALQSVQDEAALSPRATQPPSPKFAVKKIGKETEIAPLASVQRKRAGSYPLASCELKTISAPRKSWPDTPSPRSNEKEKTATCKARPKQRIEIFHAPSSPRANAQLSPRVQRSQRSPTPSPVPEPSKQTKRPEKGKKEESRGSKFLKQLKEVKVAGLDLTPLAFRKRKGSGSKEENKRRRHPNHQDDASSEAVAPTVAYPETEKCEAISSVSATATARTAEEDVAYIHAWLKGELESLTKLVPPHLRQQSAVEGVVAKPTEEEDLSDQESKPVASLITTKYLKQVFGYFETCKQNMHLPSLNMFYTFFETLLLLGHKKHMNVLLSKNNLPRLIECMQYDPKLNAKLHARLPHMQAAAKRNAAVELPPGLAELATTCYLLQYCKECVFPVVCDEARFMAFNQHWHKMKTKLVEGIIRDRKLLPGLFATIQATDATADKAVQQFRFIRELIDLAVAHYQFPEEFWHLLMDQFDLVHHLISALGSNHIQLRRSAVEIMQPLCDEEARKTLQPQVVRRPQFFQKAFELYLAANTAEEGTILQLQAVLPMLVATPEPDVLPIFYDAANAVLTKWVRDASHGVVPPPTHLCSFVELMSLCVHHHRLTCNYTSSQTVSLLISFCAELWLGNEKRPLRTNILIAVNKVILTILHLHNATFYEQLLQKKVFKGILAVFTEKNNMVNSSILTLLHTILQLEIAVLVVHIAEMWFFSNPKASPGIKGVSFVQHLFHERYMRDCSTF